MAEALRAIQPVGRLLVRSGLLGRQGVLRSAELEALGAAN